MMARIEKTVFISYRRTNIPWALAIYQNLTSQGYDVFFDYLSVKSGDFEQIIIGNIKARAHFVVILTPSALKRCNEPGDWLRREIETAVDEKRNIVPLMLESFDFGSPSTTKALTGKLEKLKKYNGLRVHSDYFFEGMGRLREQFLNVSLDAVVHPISEAAKPITEEHQIAASEATPVEKEQLSAQEWYERGIVLGDDGNFDEAIRCFTEAIRLKPDFPEAINNRGVARKKKGDIDGAIADFTRAIEFSFPERYRPFRNRADALREIGDLDGALADYDESIRLKPDFPEAINNRGLVRKDKGDIDGAIKDYTYAMEFDFPERYQCFFSRGNARNEIGDLDGALADYDEAIHLKPDFPEALTNRGIARKKKGDIDGAIKDYTRALEFDFPERFNAYMNRGNLRIRKGDIEKALSDYEEAIRLKPDFAHAYFNRALFWEMNKKFSSAVADYEKYVELGGGKQDDSQKAVKEKIKKLKSGLAKKKSLKKKQNKK